MNSLLIMGTRIVIVALIAYSIAIITEQRKKYISNFVLCFISIGIIFDITATIFMIIGSTNSPFSLHGFIGYSSLAAMLADTIFLWRFKLKYGSQTQVPKNLHVFTRIAYIWWILAFITGGLIALAKYL